MRWKLTFPKDVSVEREKWWLTSRGFAFKCNDKDSSVCEIWETLDEDGNIVRPKLEISLEEFFNNLRQAGVEVEELN